MVEPVPAPANTAVEKPLAITAVRLDPTPATPGGKVLVTAEAAGAEAVEVRPSWSGNPIQAAPAGDGRTWTVLLTAPPTPGKHPVLVTARTGQRAATLGAVLTVEGPPPVAARPAPEAPPDPVPGSAPHRAPQPAPVSAPTPAPVPKSPSTGGGGGQPGEETPPTRTRPPNLQVIEWGAVRKIVERTGGFLLGEAEPTAEFGGGWDQWELVRACRSGDSFYDLARPKQDAAYGPIASTDRSVPIYALRAQWWFACKDAAPATIVLLAGKSRSGPWYRVTAAPTGPERSAAALLPDELLGAKELWVRTEGEGGPSEWGLWGWYVTPGTWRQGGSA